MRNEIQLPYLFYSDTVCTMSLPAVLRLLLGIASAVAVLSLLAVVQIDAGVQQILLCLGVGLIEIGNSIQR